MQENLGGTTVLTLVYVHQPPRVLLGQKKRDFGIGFWNGFGGKVEAGEGVETAAVREMQEEVGVTPLNLENVGYLEFLYQSRNQLWQVHVFKTSEFEGEPVETAEMKPQWFTESEIPYQEMWNDDKHWLPLLLAGKKFHGKFVFNSNEEMVNHELTEVAKL